jgi:HlyD family secretion protein
MKVGQTGVGATDKRTRRATFSVRRHVMFATSVMLFLVLGVGGWAATANLTGAVIALGTFVVERNVKKVQHSYGGIVATINVKNGDMVAAGDVLVRLDDTQIKAEIGIIQSQLTEFKARSARLEAERDGRENLTMPVGFELTSETAAAVAAGEIRLFEESRRTRENQKQQLRLRIEQLGEEINGLTLQRNAKAGEIELIQRELEQVRMLHGKQLTPVSRVYAMERDEMRLTGEHGSLVAQIARAKGQISEIKVQISAVDENVRAQAQRELRSVEGRIAELSERQIAALDKSKRIDLRAPQAGVVHELAVHTIGGVITAAEQVMLIVPGDDNLTIQARISPADVDQVVVGRPAKLRLSAFNQQTTPELSGRVTHVAADITSDAKTGQQYYIVRLEMDEKDRKMVEDLRLVPGMPVEVFMSTGARTALSYLAKPITDQMSRAFRE